MTYVLADRGADAISLLRQSLERNPMEPNTNIVLAAAYVRSARLSEAKRQAEFVAQHFPWFAADDFGSLLRDATQREKLQALFKQAGL
jgi:hypothetical protein